jgi:hypothetical protein
MLLPHASNRLVLNYLKLFYLIYNNVTSMTKQSNDHDKESILSDYGDAPPVRGLPEQINDKTGIFTFNYRHEFSLVGEVERVQTQYFLRASPPRLFSTIRTRRPNRDRPGSNEGWRGHPCPRP